jgi:glutathione S-transferase
MADTLTLIIGNRNYSSWSLRPWILAQHLGIAIEVVRIPLDTPEFRALALQHSPTGRVPALRHGNLVIPESLAIMEYLSELAGGLGWPEDRTARARARALAHEMHGGFGALRHAYPMNIRARGRRVTMTAALAGDIERIDAIFSSAGRAGSEWLSDRYSIADAMFLPVALRFQTYGMDGLSETASRYCRTLCADPCAASWITAAAEEAEVVEHEEVGR